jgi:hypothetical protein
MRIGEGESVFEMRAEHLELRKRRNTAADGATVARILNVV